MESSGVKIFFQHSRMNIVVMDNEMVPDGRKLSKLFDFRDLKRSSVTHWCDSNL